MKHALVATLGAACLTACSAMPASHIEEVSEAARPAYDQLFSRDAAARCEGAHTIGGLRPVDGPTVRRLVRLLTDDAGFEVSDPNGHPSTLTPSECAQNALDMIGEPAVASVIPVARHSDPTVRRRAVFVLARSRDPRAVEPLLTAFRDRDVLVRRTVVLWTGGSDPRFFDAYVGALEDRDSAVRFQAARILGSFQDPRIIEVLLRNLRHHDVEVRSYAAMALSKRKDPRISPALLAALHDPSWSVQAQAALALGDQKDPAAVEPLLNLVRETPDNTARFAFIEGLGKIGDTRAYETLISCLQSANFVTRLQAVEALAALGDPRASDSILRLLNDPQPVVRESAQKALATLGAGGRAASSH